jgi:hypothetical protein
MRLKSRWNIDNYGLMLIIVQRNDLAISSVDCDESESGVASESTWSANGTIFSVKFPIIVWFFEDIRNRQPRLNITKILVMHKSGGGA